MYCYHHNHHELWRIRA